MSSLTGCSLGLLCARYSTYLHLHLAEDPRSLRLDRIRKDTAHFDQRSVSHGVEVADGHFEVELACMKLRIVCGVDGALLRDLLTN